MGEDGIFEYWNKASFLRRRNPPASSGSEKLCPVAGNCDSIYTVDLAGVDS